MAPKTVTDGFDQLTSVALNHIGMSPEFITDFARWETLKNSFDFTSVGKDEARNMVNTIGQSASKKAFEEAGKVVDKGMTVLAGVLGATGQWYGTAAALLGEEALDWAEDRFENYMGWDEDEPEAMRGDWAILDLGRRRVLEEGTFEDISPEAQDLAELHGRRLPEALSRKGQHEKHIVLVTRHKAGDGTSEIVDLKTGGRTIVNAHALAKLKDDVQARFNADEQEAAFRTTVLGGRGEAGLRSQLDSQVRRDWGKDVSFDGEHYTVSRETTAESHVFLEAADGRQIEVAWDDPRLQPVWERSNARPFPGYNPQAGFMQPSPGFNSGDYCWLDRGGDQPETDVLVCVQFVKGATARVWKATDGKCRSWNTWSKWTKRKCGRTGRPRFRRPPLTGKTAGSLSGSLPRSWASRRANGPPGIKSRSPA